MAILLYKTEDGNFADRALEELSAAGIPCHRWGPATIGDTSSLGRIGGIAAIYIERASDFRAANDILIRLGAAKEATISLPTSWTARVAILVALIAVVALMEFLLK